MKVLVTGANGFLGSHIVKTLNKGQHEVKAFILEGTSEDNLKGLNYERFLGNLLNQDDVESALHTCDAVIHTAAITDVWPKHNQLSWKINVDVVKILARAVKKQKIKKYIHVGTANSFGFGTIDHPGTEKSPYTGDTYDLDYMTSKKAAQDFLLDEAKEGLPVVIINPTFMIGSHDTKPGTGEMIISVIKGKVPGYATGGRCFAAVKDVAQGCVNALDKGVIGECYIAGGTNLCYKDFFNLIAAVAHVKPPKMKIPTWLAMTFAGILELFSKLKHKKPMLTRTMAKISGDGHYYSSQKAIDALNLPQTKLEVALTEAMMWYMTHGYIK